MNAPNEKILNYNDMKKWDVILANPPFNLSEKMLTKWFDESKAIEIMEHNLVCSNFFDWDFDNWCPIIK